MQNPQDCMEAAGRVLGEGTLGTVSSLPQWLLRLFYASAPLGGADAYMFYSVFFRPPR